jgi:hypothetical protein
MKPIYDVDIRNTETRTLRVGLVGGLCRYALGKPQLQFTAYECQDQATQRAVRAAFVGSAGAMVGSIQEARRLERGAHQLLCAHCVSMLYAVAIYPVPSTVATPR